jgi:hypothetical protein
MDRENYQWRRQRRLRKNNMRTVQTKEIVWEVGDRCFDKLHKQEATVVYVHPTKRANNIVVVHTSGDKYIGVKSQEDLEEIKPA